MTFEKYDGILLGCKYNNLNVLILCTFKIKKLIIIGVNILKMDYENQIIGSNHSNT